VHAIDAISQDSLAGAEAHAFLRTNGFTDDLAQVVDRFGSLDALAAASEAQLVAAGLPKLKARRLRELLHIRHETFTVSLLIQRPQWLFILNFNYRAVSNVSSLIACRHPSPRHLIDTVLNDVSQFASTFASSTLIPSSF